MTDMVATIALIELEWSWVTADRTYWQGLHRGKTVAMVREQANGIFIWSCAEQEGRGEAYTLETAQRRANACYSLHVARKRLTSANFWEEGPAGVHNYADGPLRANIYLKSVTPNLESKEAPLVNYVCEWGVLTSDGCIAVRGSTTQDIPETKKLVYEVMKRVRGLMLLRKGHMPARGNVHKK